MLIVDERQNIDHVNNKWLTSHEKISNCAYKLILYGKFVHVPLITRVTIYIVK